MALFAQKIQPKQGGFIALVVGRGFPNLLAQTLAFAQHAHNAVLRDDVLHTRNPCRAFGVGRGLGGFRLPEIGFGWIVEWRVVLIGRNPQGFVKGFAQGLIRGGIVIGARGFEQFGVGFANGFGVGRWGDLEYLPAVHFGIFCWIVGWKMFQAT